MQITVGVPGHVPGFDPAAIPHWARRIEELGFDALSVSDRPSWTTPEPLTSLAAVAAVTERIGLLTSVVVAPLHVNAGLFATAAATIDRVAGAGRLRLGLAPGARPHDGTDMRDKAVAATVTTAESLHDAVTGDESVGVDELILTPNDPDPVTLLRLRRHLAVTA